MSPASPIEMAQPSILAAALGGHAVVTVRALVSRFGARRPFSRFVDDLDFGVFRQNSSKTGNRLHAENRTPRSSPEGLLIGLVDHAAVVGKG